MLDELCVSCLEDVAVQRELRSGVPNSLLPAQRANVIRARVSDTLQLFYALGEESEAAARGMEAPLDQATMHQAAKWGHLDLLLEARLQRIKWDETTTMGAAIGGHLDVLQRLRQPPAPCPWDGRVVESACINGHEELAIWALEQDPQPKGNPTPPPAYPDWLITATTHGCLHVLKWAHRNHNLGDALLPTLIEEAVFRHGHDSEIVHWLNDRKSEVGAGPSSATTDD
jgi:hypothetical protein